MSAKLIKNSNGWILRGSEFPRCLQVSYGRYIFNLLHGPENYASVSGKGIWLRDLPLNLCDLARLGHTDAVSAYHAECDRRGMRYEDRAV